MGWRIVVTSSAAIDSSFRIDPRIPEVGRRLTTGNITWAVAGGWAIDLFLGCVTRQHADTDIAVWRGADTARAAFDVEDYAQYVTVQSEAAVRSVTSSHPYDDAQHDSVTTTLRGSTDIVA